ncbi:MAG: hypothetical protein P1U68_10995 [Verrucomicrobiales bacterium]|nr:hypothetical protein [Verrucomicrobiales bacterium]
MKLYSKISRNLIAITSVIGLGTLTLTSPANAQLPAETDSIKENTNDTGFRIRTKPLGDGTVLVTLTGEFQKGAPEAHAVAQAFSQGGLASLVGSDAADSFDGGDGPDYLQSNALVGSDAADSFDGGDGPDYLQSNALVGSDAADSFDGGDGPDYLQSNALVGSDAADSFDGGDGPDYLQSNALVGSDAADSLVGSDAADSFTPPFDGGDGPDYFTNLELQLLAHQEDMPTIRRIAEAITDVVTMAYDSLPISIPANELKTNGNEVALSEAYRVSLNFSSDGMATIQSLDQRNIEERWFNWSLLYPSPEAEIISALAFDLDSLLIEKEFEVLEDNEFDEAVELALIDTLLFFGFFAH